MMQSTVEAAAGGTTVFEIAEARRSLRSAMREMLLDLMTDNSSGLHPHIRHQRNDGDWSVPSVPFCARVRSKPRRRPTRLRLLDCLRCACGAQYARTRSQA
jgi:hypothetical protein